MSGVKSKSGFTLIEVSLSLVFIAILSLVVAFIINDTVASYRRGVTLNQINTAGMDIVDDMRAAIQNSSTKSVKDDCAIVYSEQVQAGTRLGCENDGASSFVFTEKRGTVKLKNGKTMDNIPLYGAFCTGSYSYLWNSGYYFIKDRGREHYFDQGSVEQVTPANPLQFKYNLDGEGKQEESNFRLLKVEDTTRAVCITVASGGASNQYNKDGLSTHIIDITNTSETVSERPIDLLKSDEANGGLALYSLYVSGPAESTAKNTLFYSVSFILGTLQGGANITKTGNFCATPDDYAVENFDYCSINKFNFAAQATGE